MFAQKAHFSRVFIDWENPNKSFLTIEILFIVQESGENPSNNTRPVIRTVNIEFTQPLPQQSLKSIKRKLNEATRKVFVCCWVVASYEIMRNAEN